MKISFQKSSKELPRSRRMKKRSSDNKSGEGQHEDPSTNNKKPKLASSEIIMMEKIINNPGLQHIIENVFLNLDYKDLMVCQLVNKSCKQILDNPMFWLKMWRMRRGLSKKNYADWSNAIQITRGRTNLEKNVPFYIKRVIETGHFVDVPCYIDREVVEKSNEITFEEVLMNLYLNPAYEDALKEKYPGFLQILAPLIENPNKYPSEIKVYTEDNETPIYWAATNGHLEIIKILAPITKNPNSNGFSRDGTPIDSATSQGFIEVIKFLATFTNNPNEPDSNGWTPIHEAALGGYLEIIKFLASRMGQFENPNPGTWDFGATPMHLACMNNHAEVVKYLISITYYQNPFVPDKCGKTPLDIAIRYGHHEIVQILVEHMNQ